MGLFEIKAASSEQTAPSYCAFASFDMYQMT